MIQFDFAIFLWMGGSITNTSSFLRGKVEATPNFACQTKRTIDTWAHFDCPVLFQFLRGSLKLKIVIF